MPSTHGERWRRIEELFAILEPLPADQREQHLLMHPPDIATAVRELLESLDAETATQSRIAANDGRPPSMVLQLPGYELQDSLGSGGAGMVYRALRLIDQGSPQPVAVKVFHQHRAGVADRQRFARELAIMATLDHPLIIKVFDGGFTAEGRPFLVMELVEGLPLTAYCERHNLDLQSRLHLMLAIFDAIAWAHARLVVHLDLKPSNILVTEHGTPKVLDFGAARLLDFGGDLTITQQITPQYASPERLRSAPPTIASDVYSLGLLLFEVLSGGWPFPARDSLIGLAERAANHSPVTSLPNAAPAGHPFRAQLGGDLEAICAKALAFDPSERYPTVNDLAQDLRCYLSGKPVGAHAPGLLYRARKFASRYYFRLAIAALFVLGLGAASAYSAYQARNARRSASQAEKAIAALTDLLSESNYGRANAGRDMTVKELLEVGAARILPSLVPDPAIGADFAVVLTRGFIAQADFKHARTTADEAGRLAEASADNTRLAAAFAARSSVYYGENRPEAAWQEAHRALNLWRSHRRDFSPERSLRVLAESGTMLLYSKPADPTAREAFAACIEIAQAASPYRAGCLEGLANSAIYSRAAYDEALPRLLEALTIRRAARPEPLALASALQSFGLANRFVGRYTEDEAAQREAHALVSAALGPDALQTANFQSVWASSLAGVGRAELGLAEAVAALAVYRRHFPQPGSNLLWTPLSAAMTNACLTRRYADCEHYAREGLQTLGPKPFLGDSRLIAAQGHLGWALAYLGRPAEAKPLLSQAIATYNKQQRRPLSMSQFESALATLGGR